MLSPFYITIGTVLAIVLLPECCNSTSLLDQLNAYSTDMFKAAFSLENVMTVSLELAVQSCQHAFRWERWNCPSSDFFLRRSTRSDRPDPEDVYVTAITTAAILYTITKNCSSGVIAGCGCQPDQHDCSDDPKRASQLYHKHINGLFSDDFAGSLRKHNYRAIAQLMQQSLTRQCGCSARSPHGACVQETCVTTLIPFDEIASQLRAMYDDAMQLSNAGANSRIMWSNIELDTLVFAQDSPNYCEPDAVPHWPGMRGRQCGQAGNRRQCRHLCRACGYQVRSKQVITEQRCNCKLGWGFQLQCELCVAMERHLYCF